MENVSYKDLKNEKFGDRVKASFGKVLAGVVIFLLSFNVLWNNEGNSVNTLKALREVRQKVITVSSDKIDPDNQGKLVYVAGNAESKEVLRDDQIGFTKNALRLIRTVKMYQWVEHESTETKAGASGGKESVATHSYTKEWSEDYNYSYVFRKYAGHENPGMFYQTAVVLPEKISLGGFELPQVLAGQITKTQQCILTKKDFENLYPRVRARSRLLHNKTIYIGVDPHEPQVGDYMISYDYVPPVVEVSVIAQQNRKTFQPYISRNGLSIAILDEGRLSIDDMITSAKTENRLLAWTMRLIGFAIMTSGLYLVLEPVAVVFSFIPLIKNILSMGVLFLSTVLALLMSITTISAAWFIFRPVQSLALMGISVVFAVFLCLFKIKNKPAKKKR